MAIAHRQVGEAFGDERPFQKCGSIAR